MKVLKDTNGKRDSTCKNAMLVESIKSATITVEQACSVDACFKNTSTPSMPFSCFIHWLVY